MKKTVLIPIVALLSLVAHAQDYPVTVEHKFGSTTLEQAPTRVVSLGLNEEDPLFALGAEPVAVRLWFDSPDGTGIFPWTREAMNTGEVEVFNMPELNYEAILALNPDFITAQYAGIDEAEYELLSEIAPTLAPSAGYPDYAMPWQDMTRTLGQALGKAREADAAIEGVTQMQDEARADLETVAAGKTVAVILPNESGFYYAFTPEDSRGQFFTSLGFSIPESFINEDAFYIEVSEERADLIDQDLLVFVGGETSEAAEETVISDPLLSQLDVVKEGRVVYLADLLGSAISYNTALSIPYALEEVVPLVQAALE